MRVALIPLSVVIAVVAITLVARGPERAPAGEPVELVEIGKFEQPVYVTSPPADDRLFVVERTGRVRIVAGGKTLSRPFLDLSKQIGLGPEGGLLSVAFAPDYARSGRFYVDYTDKRFTTTIVEYRRSADPNVADARGPRRVLVIPNPTPLHHGGLLLFGRDGFMYVGQGDGGVRTDPAGNAQRLDSLRGKILRIDPRPRRGQSYSVPASNPFVGRPGRDEIYEYGLRNPWRFSIDPATGDLFIGDVGLGKAEEIDYAPGGRAGMNFGWNCFEGTRRVPQKVPRTCRNVTFPIIEVTRVTTARTDPPRTRPAVHRGRPPVRVRFFPGARDCSIIAGPVVRDRALTSIVGRFLYGDFCNPELRSVRVVDGRATDARPLGLSVPLVASFGLDAAGQVYVVSLAGSVYRLEP